VVVKAREIMHTPVLAVDPATTALDCARKMTAAHQGYAVLLHEGQLVGIVTEWDFLAKVLALGVDPSTIPVASLASSPVHSCDAEAPTDEVVERMARESVRRMVVTEKGRVVGVVTSKEVIQSFKPYIDKLSADISRLQPSLG
jgi:signal-transduction protein with cAMP-binding, CBS, and nucleotidyltransferase domain